MKYARSFIVVIATIVVVTIFGSSIPTRAQSAPISNATVNAACLDPNDDMQVLAFAYDAGYLMCITADGDAEGVAVYSETALGSGQFTLIAGAGGLFLANDLVGYGVPSDVANSLVSSILQQLQV